MKRGSIAGAMAWAVALAGCGGSGHQESPLTFEEFRARTLQEPETGVYVLNGDEIAEDEAQLREAWKRYTDQQAAMAAGLDANTDELIVNRVGGHDDKWSTASKNNLTYCVSSSSFGSRYGAVVNAMASAAAAWHATANVTLVHAAASDAGCSRTSGTVFNVRQVSTQQYLARSFFPSTSRSGREILISSSSFGNISPWTVTGILRHELGHVLGFRHEHTRPQAGTCFEDNNWRALTGYDSDSVMHYPQCNGTNPGDLVLTSKDKTGARALYP